MALRYGAALAVAAATLLATGALEGTFQGVLLSVPIAVTALLALALGSGPGLVQAAIVGVGIWYLFFLPNGSFVLTDHRETVRLAAYFVSSLSVLAAIGLLDRTRRRLAAAHARAEEALAEQRAHAERLRTLAENSPEVIARFDRQLRHTYVNGFGARVYGRRPEEVLGRTNAELGMPAQKVAYWQERFEQVFASGEQQTVDFDFDSPNLGHRSFSSLFVPETDERGRVASVLAITRDVTELRRAERTLREERDFIAAVVDTAASLVVVLDRDGRLRRCNRACEEATGYSAAELQAMTWADLVPAEELPGVRRVWQTLTLGDFPNQYENHWRSKDGTLQLFAWSNTALTDEEGRLRFIVATGIDITERHAAESELRRAEEHRRLALEGAALGTWDYDLARGAVFFDERFRAIMGVSGDALPYPEVIASLIHPEDRARVDAEVQRAIAGGGAFDAEFRIVRPDGALRWTRSRGQALLEGQGAQRRATRFVGTLADTTSARQAEETLRESEARFRQLADSMPQLVWTARADGTVDYYNERIHELSGARRGEDGAWRWEAVLHPDDLEATRAAWDRAVRTGERYEIAHRVQRADGQLHWYLSRGLPVRDGSGRVARWYGTATDIDVQKQAEEALREADQRKNEFLGMLSHELRNPLAPIRNSLYVLERAAPDGPQARRAHEIIERQVGHLSRLVDDLLDVTRISRGKVRLQRERLELCELVHRTAEDHRSLFSSSGLHLEVGACPGPLLAMGDSTRLAQVIGNLLSNAAKFTPRGGRVSLSLDAEGGTATIRVRDTGPGIAAGMLTELFEPFVQAEATLDRSKGGLGLGLALVKGLVELHGGTVSAHSDGAGQGTEFSVRLPLEAVRAGAPAFHRAPAEAPCGQTRRVLVIEDNTDAAESLKEALELGGHEVQVANAGPEGLLKARSFRPQVVVCDIGLPGMNGYEVARRMRSDPELRRASLVALSGYAQPEDLERSKEAGFLRHLAKPPDLGVLERALWEAPAGE